MNVLYDLLLPAPDFSRALAFLLSNSPSVNKDNILYHQADDLTPMHYACSEGAGAELIQLMLNNTKPKPKDPTNINICSLLDDTGNTPCKLHAMGYRVHGCHCLCYWNRCH